MYVKTQNGDLILLFHFSGIYVINTQNSIAIKAGSVILGTYQDKECAKLVMKKIEEAIINDQKLMEMPTKEDVSRWLEL